MAAPAFFILPSPALAVPASGAALVRSHAGVSAFAGLFDALSPVPPPTCGAPAPFPAGATQPPIAAFAQPLPPPGSRAAAAGVLPGAGILPAAAAHAVPFHLPLPTTSSAQRSTTKARQTPGRNATPPEATPDGPAERRPADPPVLPSAGPPAPTVTIGAAIPQPDIHADPALSSIEAPPASQGAEPRTVAEPGAKRAPATQQRAAWAPAGANPGSKEANPAWFALAPPPPPERVQAAAAQHQAVATQLTVPSTSEPARAGRVPADEATRLTAVPSPRHGTKEPAASPPDRVPHDRATVKFTSAFASVSVSGNPKPAPSPALPDPQAVNDPTPPPDDACDPSVRPHAAPRADGAPTGSEIAGEPPASPHPASTQSVSTQPDSAQPGSAHPGSAQPGSAHLGSGQAISGQRGPTQPGSAQRGPPQAPAAPPAEIVPAAPVHGADQAPAQAPHPSPEPDPAGGPAPAPSQGAAASHAPPAQDRSPEATSRTPQPGHPAAWTDGFAPAGQPQLQLQSQSQSQSQPTILPGPARHAAEPAAPQSAYAPPAGQIGQALATLQGAPSASGHISIRLDPQELGSVRIELRRDRDGTATLTLTVERPETLRGLQADIAHLHQALDRAGLPADQRSVTFHLAQASDQAGSPQAGGFGQAAQGEQKPGQQHQPNSRPTSASNAPLAGQGAEQTLPQPARPWARAGFDITA